MDDENGLELSLGLGCGVSSSKSNAKAGSVSDERTEEVERSNKVVDDFKNFLHATPKQMDSGTASLKSDSVKLPENLYIDSSIKMFSTGNRSIENEDEKRLEVGGKHKMVFDDRDAHLKASHISVTTEDGSTANNVDVAESEVEGSTSRSSSLLDDGTKQFNAVLGHSEAPKDVRRFSGSGERRDNSLSENEYKSGTLMFGVSFSGQPVNAMNTSRTFAVKESIGAHTPSSSLTGKTQVVPIPNGGQRPVTRPRSPGNLPVMFGYSPVQLPILDKDNSRGMILNHQQFHPSYAGRGSSNSASQALQSGRSSTEPVLEQARSDGKQKAPEGGSSSQAEDDSRGNSFNQRPKAPAEQMSGEGFAMDFSAIMPGIAADLKFGGCGSYPDLPWVSTTAPGPNGRTISGVTYRFSATQIRIVCACHGSHMSPEEFVRHASEEAATFNGGSGLATISNNNPATSAQS